MKSSISVCISTYQRPEFLQEALYSVFEQTLQPIEIVIGDDSHDDLTENLFISRTMIKNQIKQIIKASPIGQVSKSYISFSQWWGEKQWENRRKAYFAKNIDLYGRILTPEQGNSLIADRIVDNEPLMISRFGNTELDCAYGYMQGSYKEGMINEMMVCSGFFPQQEKLLDQFSEIYLEASKMIDILGVWWFLPGEAEIIRSYSPEANLVNLSTLEPYYHDNPWSKNLKNKKVLVIHPFTDTILEQYIKHREILFKNKDILPQFELMTFKSVQSVVGTKTEFDTWFDAYDWMRDRIKEYDFDIAIIGCGAYGLPLAAYVKSLGKKAVHLGGATQILFGIKGKRWDERPFFQSLYNEHWVRPKSEETPQNFQKLGAYW
jgi:glycosyltransferase involved in cell wall biosynthesis